MFILQSRLFVLSLWLGELLAVKKFDWAW